MTSDRFDSVIQSLSAMTIETLSFKAFEYAGEDRLESFTLGSRSLGISRSAYCLALAEKHATCVRKAVQQDDPKPPGFWREKLGDFIAYQYLLMACLEEDGLIQDPSQS